MGLVFLFYFFSNNAFIQQDQSIKYIYNVTKDHIRMISESCDTEDWSENSALCHRNELHLKNIFKTV